jgi:hypothetical protein
MTKEQLYKRLLRPNKSDNKQPSPTATPTVEAVDDASLMQEVEPKQATFDEATIILGREMRKFFMGF